MIFHSLFAPIICLSKALTFKRCRQHYRWTNEALSVILEVGLKNGAVKSDRTALDLVTWSYSQFSIFGLRTTNLSCSHGQDAYQRSRYETRKPAGTRVISYSEQ